MNLKFPLIFLTLLLICSSTATATPILMTIAETENGQTDAWWPNQPGFDKQWQDIFERQGISLVHPEEIHNYPRLSPTIYGQKPLSDNNAATLASLFGASGVINGQVTWKCHAIDKHQRCSADIRLKYIYGPNGQISLDRTLTAVAPTAQDAKKYVMTRLAADVAMPVIAHAQAAKNTDIPRIIDKPVIIFDPLPDADTLVALRKQLKRVPGIEDVAERWAADGMLAIEINPASPAMSQSEFLLYVQGFMNESTENLVIRQTKQSENGAIFEVVKF
ncbi:MAG: hypothetical protein IJU23_12640 [Proteobacteria bacterium]|nr:hypothetical protein [Pseudomonadota bacterium]